MLVIAYELAMSGLKAHSYSNLSTAVRPDKMPPILALGGGITLAAVLNVLRRNQLPYYALCSPNDFVSYSRWYRPLPTLFPDPKPSDLEAVLSTLELESAFLLPCSDDWLRAVVELPDSLAARFPSNTSRACVDILTDKWRFAELLKQLRIPRPQTHLISSLEELSAIPDSAFEGAILKPLSSASFACRHGVKGYVVQGRTEADHYLRDIELPVMLQEFVPGPPDTGYFLDGYRDRAGRIAAMFGRQRLRMYPARLGNSTLIESVPLRSLHGAIFPLEFLLDRISYCGIFSAEFKYDNYDRQFKLIEINARPWWYVEFAAQCGVDVCDLAYRDAMGQSVPQIRGYDVGRQGCLILQDLRAWKARGKQHAGFFSMLKSWSQASSTPFHWNDPVAAIRYAFQSLHALPTVHEMTPMPTLQPHSASEESSAAMTPAAR